MAEGGERADMVKKWRARNDARNRNRRRAGAVSAFPYLLPGRPQIAMEFYVDHGQKLDHIIRQGRSLIGDPLPSEGWSGPYEVDAPRATQANIGYGGAESHKFLVRAGVDVVTSVA